MLASHLNRLTLIGALAFALPLFSSTEEGVVESISAPQKNPVLENIVEVSMVANVVAIDHEHRVVALKGPGGNTFSVSVEREAAALNEIAVGDAVTVDYLTSLAFELREATAEEIANPLTVTEGTVTIPDSVDPTVGEVSVIQAVCTVEGLDRELMTAKLKGPLGNYNIVSVTDPKTLTLVRIGDTVVVKYTESLAISLSKVGSKEGQMETNLDTAMEGGLSDKINESMGL